MSDNQKCEEVIDAIGNYYLRCNKPAVALIQHRGRTEGPYHMCYACADHNIRNRDAALVHVLENAPHREELERRWKK